MRTGPAVRSLRTATVARATQHSVFFPRRSGSAANANTILVASAHGILLNAFPMRTRGSLGFGAQTAPHARKRRARHRRSEEYLSTKSSTLLSAYLNARTDHARRTVWVTIAPSGGHRANRSPRVGSSPEFFQDNAARTRVTLWCFTTEVRGRARVHAELNAGVAGARVGAARVRPVRHQLPHVDGIQYGTGGRRLRPFPWPPRDPAVANGSTRSPAARPNRKEILAPFRIGEG